jgi:hypothetical protein
METPTFLTMETPTFFIRDNAFVVEVLRLAKEHGNDMTLGSEIRKLILARKEELERNWKEALKQSSEKKD